MLQLKGEKMSKSLGNLVTVEEFLAEHSPEAFRLLVLNSHYRGPLTYTEDVVGQAEAALDRLRGGLKAARPSAAVGAEVATALGREAETTRRRFVEAMEDDFNTPKSLAALFDLVRAINQARDAGVDAEALAAGQAVLLELAGVFGLQLERPRGPLRDAGGDRAPYIELLVEIRDELRRAELWALADRIRDRLAEQGVTLEDDPDGTRWESR
jgi:cysteinyl-tRNA synthetase